MDAVVIGSVLTVIGAVVILAVLGFRLARLIKTTHSQDEAGHGQRH